MAGDGGHPVAGVLGSAVVCVEGVFSVVDELFV